MPAGGTEAEQRAVDVMLAKQVFPRSNEVLSWTTEREADEADEAGLRIIGCLQKIAVTCQARPLVAGAGQTLQKG